MKLIDFKNIGILLRAALALVVLVAFGTFVAKIGYTVVTFTWNLW